MTIFQTNIKYDICQYGGAGKDALSYAIAMEEIRSNAIPQCYASNWSLNQSIGIVLFDLDLVQPRLCGHGHDHDGAQQHLHGTDQGAGQEQLSLSGCLISRCTAVRSRRWTSFPPLSLETRWWKRLSILCLE